MSGDLVELITKTYGLVGLLMIAPVISTVWLWLHIAKTRNDSINRETAHSKQIIEITGKHVAELKESYDQRLKHAAELQEKVAEVQRMRVDDAQSVVTKLITTISEQTATTTETNLALERMGDFIALNQTKALPPHNKGGKE